MMAAAASYGLGRYDIFLTPGNRAQALRFVFTYEMTGIWAGALLRISIAIILISLHRAKIWHAILWGTVSIQLAAALASTICLFIQCRPLRAMWDIVPDARCWAPPQLHIYGFVYTGKYLTCHEFSKRHDVKLIEHPGWQVSASLPTSYSLSCHYP